MVNLEAAYWQQTFSIVGGTLFYVYISLDFVSWYTSFSATFDWTPTNHKYAGPFSVIHGSDEYECLAEHQLLYMQQGNRVAYSLLMAPFLGAMTICLVCDVFSSEMKQWLLCLINIFHNLFKKTLRFFKKKCCPKKLTNHQISEVLHCQDGEEGQKNELPFETKHAIATTCIRIVCAISSIYLVSQCLWSAFTQQLPVEGSLDQADLRHDLVPMNVSNYMEKIKVTLFVVSLPFFIVALLLSLCVAFPVVAGLSSVGAFLVEASYDDYHRKCTQMLSFFSEITHSPKKDGEQQKETKNSGSKNNAQEKTVGTVGNIPWCIFRECFYTLLIIGTPLLLCFLMVLSFLTMNSSTPDQAIVVCVRNTQLTSGTVMTMLLLFLLQFPFLPFVLSIFDRRELQETSDKADAETSGTQEQPPKDIASGNIEKTEKEKSATVVDQSPAPSVS